MAGSYSGTTVTGCPSGPTWTTLSLCTGWDADPLLGFLAVCQQTASMYLRKGKEAMLGTVSSHKITRY